MIWDKMHNTFYEVRLCNTHAAQLALNVESLRSEIFHRGLTILR